MQVPRQWVRRVALWTAVAGTTSAVVLMATAAQAANPAHVNRSHAAPAAKATGPGYPHPRGIWYPFTDCPLLNPLMQETLPGAAAGCVAGYTKSGSIKIGNITTTLTKRVVAQFGIFSPPDAGANQFTGGTLPPPDGLASQLVSPPELVPGGLLKALGCPNKNGHVQQLCTEAQQHGGKYLQVYAQAVSLAPVTNFNLTTWTQGIEFQLINPLLGSYCSIGSSSNPVIVNPSITGTLVQELDPNFPNTGVLEVKNASATDTTFTAPAVIGCGPGGATNIPVDLAIDKSVGLPSATTLNSLTLNGTFYLGVAFSPRYQANLLLKAFKASVKHPPAVVPAQHRISFSGLRGHWGLR